MADIDRRIELQAILEGILGSKNVYFQPGGNIKMSYPAIVYSRNGISVNHADNLKYNHTVSYKVTVIDLDPDSRFVEPLLELPMCAYESHYETDNLNHDVFTISY